MDLREHRTSHIRAELKKLLQRHMRVPPSSPLDGRSSPTSGSQRSSIPIAHGRSNSAGMLSPTRLQGEAGPSSSVPRSEREQRGKEFVQRDDDPQAELTRMIGKLGLCSFSEVRRYKTMF